MFLCSPHQHVLHRWSEIQSIRDDREVAFFCISNSKPDKHFRVLCYGCVWHDKHYLPIVLSMNLTQIVLKTLARFVCRRCKEIQDISRGRAQRREFVWLTDER